MKPPTLEDMRVTRHAATCSACRGHREHGDGAVCADAIELRREATAARERRDALAEEAAG